MQALYPTLPLRKRPAPPWIEVPCVRDVMMCVCVLWACAGAAASWNGSCIWLSHWYNGSSAMRAAVPTRGHPSSPHQHPLRQSAHPLCVPLPHAGEMGVLKLRCVGGCCGRACLRIRWQFGESMRQVNSAVLLNPMIHIAVRVICRWQVVLSDVAGPMPLQ
jgi:hypothetical protein